MTNNETEDEYETVYQVYSQFEYGFGGDDTVWIAVTEETEDRIVGRVFSPIHPEPGERIAFTKDRVAGWKEDSGLYKRLTEGDEEWERAMGYHHESG